MLRIRVIGVMMLAPSLALWMAGCAKAQAKTQPERVPLEVPAAPPRVIAAVMPEPPPEEAPAPAAPAAPARPPVRPRPPRETPPRVEPPKAEPSPARPVTPRLRTPQSATDAEVERTIRDALTRASRALDSVNPAALTPDARSQYDTARRFIQQAEEGVQAKNYVFAGNLADKAETLAAALLGR